MEQDTNPVRELEANLGIIRPEQDFSLYDICRCTHRRWDHVGGVKECTGVIKFDGTYCKCKRYQVNLRVDGIPPELQKPPPPRFKYHITLNRELFQWFVEIYGFQKLEEDIALHYLKQELRRTWGIVDYYEFEIRIQNSVHKYQPHQEREDLDLPTPWSDECTHCGCTTNHPNHLT